MVYDLCNVCNRVNYESCRENILLIIEVKYEDFITVSVLRSGPNELRVFEC